MAARHPGRNGGRRARGDAAAVALGAAARHHLAGRLVDSFEICRNVLDGAPGHPEALKRLAALARDADHPEAALDFATAGLVGAPRDPAMHVEYALAQEALGCVADAETALHRALACGPSPDAFVELARLLAAGHRFAESLDAARAAVGLRTDAAAHRAVGVALAALGRPDGAAESFGRAIALDPSDADAHFALGRLRLAAGDDAAAASALRLCLRLDPGDFRGARALLRRLDSGVEPAAVDTVAARRRRLRRLLTRVPGHQRTRAPRTIDLDAAGAPPAAAIAAAAPGAAGLVIAPAALARRATLGPAFAAAARALAAGGLFAFALRPHDRGTDIAILPGGEFRHGEAYVRRLAPGHGFVVVDIRRSRETRTANDGEILLCILRRRETP